ncbi:peptide ABC transporter substrate-binding protein [Borrelia anserina]|uniref:Oligopeptide-binding protein oppA n=2 Tax=Borrelia anserina TaxID=143 RepID=W5SNU4_BORAN|nr:peptide ABC transporter substrate-binding protein [Borrelia anserina]AHH08298.1 Oligopeptide-binding protein oppA [Borrelia anserina BA2]APR64811.1 ABC transporter substrate-binding protein [Borrelia anserina Es]UPA06724.1 peptide ABC transporter substrate-binding protein [Borrelia anserina]
MKIKQQLFIIFFFIAILSCSKENSKEHSSFKITMGGEPKSIDPQLAEDKIGAHIIAQMFSGIVEGDSKTGGYKPGLAKSWDISDDGTVYTFHLREGVIWSDGVPITAEGIRKSYLRILNKETASNYVGMVKSTIKNAKDYYEDKISESELGIRAIDNSTLEITLIAPKPYFLDMLVHQTFTPIPIHAIEKYGNDWTKPENMVVSGAYKLKERIPNEKIVLEKNDKYYKSKDVELQEVIFYTITDASTAYRMYENNEIDALSIIPPDLIKEIKLRNDYYSSAINGLYYFSFNTQIKPLDNVKVRKALTLAIDRETLMKKVINNGSIPTRNITPTFNHYSYGKPLKLFDPNSAKQLLAEAGYPDGAGFPELTIKYNTSESHKKITEFIQNQWARILNIKVKLENEEWASFLETKQKGNYEIARAGWIGDYSDPLTFLSLFQKEFSHFSSYEYFNKEYENLINQSDIEQDPIKRQDILRKAEAIIIEQDFPIAPIYIYAGNYLFRNDKWTGWSPNISERFYFSELKRK